MLAGRTFCLTPARISFIVDGMSQIPSSLSSSRFLGIIFGLLMCSCWGTGTARASCGDWLAHPEPSRTETISGIETPATPLGRPCHGPNCQTAPTSPVKAPVPTVPTTRIQDLAVQTGHIAVPRFIPDSSQSQSKSCSSLPDGYRLEVDRPPESIC